MNLCIEKKTTLSGRTQTYRCGLLSLREGVGILRHVIDREYDVAGFRLSPGDETIAVFWEDRPYTLYIWVRKQQADRAYYINIADSIILGHEEFSWRDLAVDILVTGDGRVRVLDEHELPHDLPAGLLQYIMKAKDEVLAGYRDIVEEANRLISTATR
jgi:hypothetical protein